MFILPSDADDLRFPPVELASPEGLLAIGGDLCSERLLEAYRHGIFPWYSGGQPILWWSPDPRAVLLPSKLKISRSLRQTLRRDLFHVTLDSDFAGVVKACAEPRAQNPNGGTWITAEMIDAYCRLHEQGFAHSVEVWTGDDLAGGLYGVALGGAFFGESMFSRQSNASKVALAYLARQLDAWGFVQIDCQLPSLHLMSLGAIPIRRKDFLSLLDTALALTDRLGGWRFDTDLVVL
jgi:leucyl/phenylalanyl-tRNA--protein transferase